MVNTQIVVGWFIRTIKMLYFCFCCLLFSDLKTKLTIEENRDRKNMSSFIADHESSMKHIHAISGWIELENRLKEGKQWIANIFQHCSRCCFVFSWCFTFFFGHGLNTAVPNVAIALRKSLAIPITVASGERSFSKFKLI